MNFETWFKQQKEMDEIGEYSGKAASESGWNACKNEVLKILDDNHVRIPEENGRPVFDNDGSWYFGKIDMLEQIKKL